MNLELTQEQAQVLATALGYYVSAVERAAVIINSRDDSGLFMDTAASNAAAEIRSVDKTLDELIPLFLDIDTFELSQQMKEWESFTA